MKITEVGLSSLSVSTVMKFALTQPLNFPFKSIVMNRLPFIRSGNVES